MLIYFVKEQIGILAKIMYFYLGFCLFIQSSLTKSIWEYKPKHVFHVALEKLFYLYYQALGNSIQHCL